METVVKEYNAQMGKWKAYQNLVVDAQIAAKEDIKKILSDIQKESAEREARWAKYSMFAMSLIGLAGVSFMSGIIQYKLYPEFIDKMSNPALKNLTADYGRAVAKVFGDAIGKTTGMGIDAVFSAVIPAQRVNNARPVQLETAISGGNLTSYRTSLENLLLAEAGKVTGQLAAASENINRDSDFGKKMLIEVEKGTPLFQKLPDAQKELAGMKYLDEYFDNLRQQYAKDWFYYGNNPIPSPQSDLTFHIEAEMWALFILDQKFHSKQRDNATDEEGPTYFVTNDGLELWDIRSGLGIFARNNVARQLDQQTENRSLEKALVDAGTGFTWLQDQTYDGDVVPLVKWARSNPGSKLRGKMDYRPRLLGTIAQPETLFRD